MRDLISQILDCLDGGKPVVCCRLVETRGSTPQKAGAMMLVFPDSSQAGTLGGGCVEAEVKRQALRIAGEAEARIATFHLDSDYGWDDGLICGGRMGVLIDPLAKDQARGYFQQLAEVVGSAGGGTEAIVFDADKSGCPAASCYLFDDQDRLVDSLRGDGRTTDKLQSILENLVPIATRPRSYAAAGVGFLPLVPRCRLLIVGGGHVGQSLAALAADLDFDVWVLDDREDVVSEARFPSADRRITGPIEQVLRDIEITPDTYCVIVTRGHNHDEQALHSLAQRGARYVGMIGSRRKIKLIFDDLIDAGVSADALRQVHAPLGIDIGSQTVAEIAVSIAAELVSHRNRCGIVPGRPEAISVSGIE